MTPARWTSPARVQSSKSESATIDMVEIENCGYKEPRVTLVYGDDYEAVRNLPRRRIKKTAKKRVGSWARKAFAALVTSMAALAYPVVEGCHMVHRLRCSGRRARGPGGQGRLPWSCSRGVPG